MTKVLGVALGATIVLLIGAPQALAADWPQPAGGQMERQSTRGTPLWHTAGMTERQKLAF